MDGFAAINISQIIWRNTVDLTHLDGFDRVILTNFWVTCIMDIRACSVGVICLSEFGISEKPILHLVLAKLGPVFIASIKIKMTSTLTLIELRYIVRK